MSDVVSFLIFAILLVGFAGFMAFLIWRQEKRHQPQK
jgi:preprotein translocase subunit YajC